MPTLNLELAAALSKRTRAEWLAAFKAAEVPAGPINDIPAVVEDPQVRGARHDSAGWAMAPSSGNRSTSPPIRKYPNSRRRGLANTPETVLAEYGYSQG